MKTLIQYLIEDALNKAIAPDVRSAIMSAGGTIYQIGGAVRDELLGKVSKDLDLLIVGVSLKELNRILARHGKVNQIGKSFGILKFKPEGSDEVIDISVPRVDEKSTGKGHKDFKIKLGKGITLQQDQLRRDFWMNALAKDIESGEIVDIKDQGKVDIENKQVRVISPQAFTDDPLRMLRAVQFAARFEFTIEAETLKQIQKNVRLITTISAERIQEEFRKMFEKGIPSIGVNYLIETGLLKALFPKAVFQVESSRYDNLTKDAFPAFLAILLHSYGSKTKGVVMRKMRLSKDEGRAVQEVVNFNEDYANLNPDSSGPDHEIALVNFVQGVSLKGLSSINSFLESQRITTITNKFKAMKRQGKPTSLKELAVSGRELIKLGAKGKKIGETLRYLLDYSIKNSVNQSDELLSAARQRLGVK